MNTECHRTLTEITEWKALQRKQCKLDIGKPTNNVLDLFHECLQQSTENIDSFYLKTVTTTTIKITYN